MSQIRNQSLKATSWIYIGFLIGAINTYFFTHKDWFGTPEYGLTRALLDISMLTCAFSTLGVTTYIVKFFPYYKDIMGRKKNDLLGTALKVSMFGFLFTTIFLFLLHPLIIRKFSENSQLLVEYFYYVIPFSFFILLYNILEAYAYGFDKGVFTSFLRELILRIYTLVIIILKVFGIINFKYFILLFSCQFLIIIFILIIHLYKENVLWIAFRSSKVTKRYRKKIFSLLSLTTLIVIVTVLRQAIDGLVLAAKQDLSKVGIFGFATYLVSLLQAPFRSIVAVTIPILSRSWKAKDFKTINKIYERSSVNLLSFALFTFFAIWLNYENAILLFGINAEYLEGKWVFFVMGLVAIIEMGTGVNGQIIGTSIYWKFDLWTSLLLTILILPLSYFLTTTYGIMGPAFANLISFSVYNFARYWFLYKNFKMQPFSIKTLEAILIATISFIICYFLFNDISGIIGIIVRLLCFATLFIMLMVLRNVTPDLKALINQIPILIPRSRKQ
ncbi:MAG: lipopolysaccharide biosynthesis protein [Bacteroidetes bacterium]|nr:lipopolysaccharide biosynthesis protein [Bacteroidota bacterium]